MFAGRAYLFATLKYFSFAFISVYSLCNATFFHCGYVIKPPQPSSGFTELLLLQGTQTVAFWRHLYAEGTNSCFVNQLPTKEVQTVTF